MAAYRCLMAVMVASALPYLGCQSADDLGSHDQDSSLDGGASPSTGQLDATLSMRGFVDAFIDTAVVDTTPEASSRPSCVESTAEWIHRFERTSETHLACSMDSECILLDVNVTCPPATRIQFCGVAVASGAAPIVSGRLDAQREEFCASAALNCSSASHCSGAVKPRCREGQCRYE
jgi:hypothetical protein